MLENYFPERVNSGVWVSSYTLNALRELPANTKFTLPICSINTPYSELTQTGTYLLPPLFTEAMKPELRDQLVKRIIQCFPEYDSALNESVVEIVEIPGTNLPKVDSPKVLAFSVDTAVEEHGPHLPLGTDTIQSYSVLNELASEFDGFQIVKPLEYGQLTWGLPFGHSIDITTDLLKKYVTGYCNALTSWMNPETIYVVDVHGSITHRQAIVDGLKDSTIERWAFRWLHDPLPEFASERGDQHAGGVETILVERSNPKLLDPAWWPERISDLAARQMTFEKAVELTPQLSQFFEYVKQNHANGIIGDINNYHALDADELFRRMLELAKTDVQKLLSGNVEESQSAGQDLW